MTTQTWLSTVKGNRGQPSAAPSKCPYCASRHIVLWEVAPPQVWHCDDCAHYFSAASAGRIEYKRRRAARGE